MLGGIFSLYLFPVYDIVMGIFAVFAIVDHGERAALTTFWREEQFEFHGVVRNRGRMECRSPGYYLLTVLTRRRLLHSTEACR